MCLQSFGSVCDNSKTSVTPVSVRTKYSELTKHGDTANVSDRIRSDVGSDPTSDFRAHGVSRAWISRNSPRVDIVCAQECAELSYACSHARTLCARRDFRARSAPVNLTSARIRWFPVGSDPTSDFRARCARENSMSRAFASRSNARNEQARVPARALFACERIFARARAKRKSDLTPDPTACTLFYLQH